MTWLTARDVAGPCLVSEHYAALYHLAGTRPSLMHQVDAHWRASSHARTQVPVVGRVNCCPTRTGTECGYPRQALEFAQVCLPHVGVPLFAELRLAGRTLATSPGTVARSRSTSEAVHDDRRPGEP